jgi:hypothetical protein
VSEFSHPAALPLLAELSKLFQKARIYETDKPIMFVCGGKIEVATNIRPRLVDWVKNNFPDTIVLLAEAAFQDTILHDPPKILNVSTFERLIGAVADCVLVIPESAGSLAELGLFSQLKDIRTKTLVISDVAHHASGFVAFGPIRTIDEKSYLRPSIPVIPSNPDFMQVAERLGRVMLRKKARLRKFEFKPFKQFGQLQRMQITLEIVRLCQVISLDGLRQCVKAVFGTASYESLKQMLSILVAMGYVSRAGNSFKYIRPGDSLLNIQGYPVERLKARIAYYYMKHQTQAYEKLAGIVDAS